MVYDKHLFTRILLKKGKKENSQKKVQTILIPFQKIIKDNKITDTTKMPSKYLLMASLFTINYF
ncbi:hypothetical protein B0A68_11890 [Flavobacterium reichenbachii]|uniref:Uncharacterized protein n=1 Tax=Flavobacterium reichenbachii TaxID=362418 RepID=A0A085ZNL3_9FLAO|nr:hypothetical protein IW19_11055 [Flavobacterium reichenbachii]OXB14747.1 hypothetical protein B0A68_11890 [Flavobacterium reichenbachii]